MSKEVIVRTGAGVGMLLVGTALGIGAYLLLKRKMEDEFERRLEVEVGETKNFYARLHKKAEFDDPTVLAEAYEEIVEEEAYIQDGEAPPKPPYVISWEEFASAVLEYDQDTLTYFEGDDTLVDGRDDVVDDVDGNVGSANLCLLYTSDAADD